MSSQPVISAGDHIAWIVDRVGGLTAGSREGVLRAINAYFEFRGSSSATPAAVEATKALINMFKGFSRVAKALGVDDAIIDSWAYMTPGAQADLPDACIQRIAWITEQHVSQLHKKSNEKSNADLMVGDQFIRVARMLDVDISDNPRWDGLAERCMSTITTLRNHDAIKTLNEDHDREELKLKTEIQRLKREPKTCEFHAQAFEENCLQCAYCAGWNQRPRPTAKASPIGDEVG